MDGTLWMGLGFGAAELVRFDPSRRAYLPVTPRPQGAGPVQMICDVTEGIDGQIYYATAPQAQLWRYSTKNKQHYYGYYQTSSARTCFPGFLH